MTNTIHDTLAYILKNLHNAFAGGQPGNVAFQKIFKQNCIMEETSEWRMQRKELEASTVKKEVQMTAVRRFQMHLRRIKNLFETKSPL